MTSKQLNGTLYGKMSVEMREMPVYNHSGIYAREHGELERYRASRQANLACRNAIDDAISRHYQNNSLSKDAVTEVIEAFGFERTTYVLANTIQRQDWDRRYSTANREWANTVDVCENRDDFNGDKRLEFTLRSHPGLVNIFTSEVRHELLLTLPLTKEDIQVEAQRLLKSIQRPQEPNSPDGLHFMAKLSDDFVARASSKDQAELRKMFQIKGCYLGSPKDRPGVFLFAPRDADRGLPLCKPRASVRTKLQEAKPVASVSKPVTRDKGMEL